MKQKQTGIALFVSLIFLIIMTLLGITALQVTSLQERMSGNVREYDLAFQRAEAGLRMVETGISDFIVGNRSDLPGGGVGRTWVEAGLQPSDCAMLGEFPDLNAYDDWRSVAGENYDVAIIDLTDFRDSDPLGTTADGLGRGSNCRPMDEGPQDASGFYYLVNVRATGPAETSQVILQSIFYWPN